MAIKHLHISNHSEQETNQTNAAYPHTAIVIIDTFLLALSVSLGYQGKGKAIPLQAWTGPEGSRRLRFPDFKTVGT